MDKSNRRMMFALIVVMIIIVGVLLGIHFFSHHQLEKQENTDTTAETPTKSTAPKVSPESYDYNASHDPFGENKSAPVDYYMMALSWSPGFCKEQTKKHDGNLPQRLQYQCASDKEYGWVLHGIWAENAKARQVNDHPRLCKGDLPPVKQQVLNEYLDISPGLALLQGEWEKHGACIFDEPEDYFAKGKELYEELTLPDANYPNKKLFRWLREHNPQLRNKFMNARGDELFICYDKSWEVMDCQTM